MQNHTIRYNTMQYYTTVFNFKQCTVPSFAEHKEVFMPQCTALCTERPLFLTQHQSCYTIQYNTMQYPTIHHFWRVPGYVVPYTVTVTVFQYLTHKATKNTRTKIRILYHSTERIRIFRVQMSLLEVRVSRDAQDSVGCHAMRTHSRVPW